MATKNIKIKIKEYFFLNPTARLRVRQIERQVKVPLPSAIRYTKELEKENLLKKLNISNVTFYMADRTSKQFILEKKLFNIKLLFSSGLVDFLVENLSNPNIVVFGSYAKGEDIEGSDIDLYIETPSNKKINLDQFEGLIYRPIHVFTYNNIKKIKNKRLINNIMNGTVLNGFIEVL